jgi:hypothetical protein
MLYQQDQELCCCGRQGAVVAVVLWVYLCASGFMLPNPDDAVIWRGPRCVLQL